jgi:GNAT superfamily N-acetyltransferase
MTVEYRTGADALPVDAFIRLARRIWNRDYDVSLTGAALRATINVGAWSGDRLVGAVRVLSDGYFFSTVPEVMVDPEFRRHGVGLELMRRALELAPGGALYLGAQPGNEPFFERAGFRRGPTGYVGRRQTC